MLKEVQSICTVIEENKRVFKSIANRNFETTISVNSMFEFVKIYIKSYYDLRDDEEKLFVSINANNDVLLELKFGNKKVDVSYSLEYSRVFVQALFNDVLNYLKSLVKNGK